MFHRRMHLWICTLILSLLGQLGWAAAMPLPVAATLPAPVAHATHPADKVLASDVPHAGADHCAPSAHSGDTSSLGGHACCPFVGLASSPAWSLPVDAPQRYGPAIADAAHDGLASAIFKPPKR